MRLAASRHESRPLDSRPAGAELREIPAVRLQGPGQAAVDVADLAMDLGRPVAHQEREGDRDLLRRPQAVGHLAGRDPLVDATIGGELPDADGALGRCSDPPTREYPSEATVHSPPSWLAREAIRSSR